MKKSHRNRQTVVRVLLLLSLHSSGTAFVVTLPNRILPVLEEQRYCLSLSSSSPSSPSNFDSEQEQTQSVLRKDKDGKRNRKKDSSVEMPWGDHQEWALRDNMSKYLITISSYDEDEDDDRVERHNFALWRSMIRDVTELTGYPVKFVYKMYSRQSSTTPGVLPFLDQFEFTEQGGIQGRCYGLPGIADGTLIETPSVKGVQQTVPSGYIVTESGVAYELGIPLGDLYSLDGGNSASRAQMQKMLQQTLASTTIKESVNAVAETGSSLVNGVQSAKINIDGSLVNLGASTAVLLAGATAMGMLSHHLTLNVFWV
eukprot:CAMPEP_0197837614 /NCGR_PEP_ID=MMETSP1437-20131217/32701_1 /TAXON_ID=49252 ORGANISM="Eucampia antarctica, Strain CCMP1452" /NCGR_SAMPLE_ID=MMETSP1437 /ASSEMBLY_ACC=CAM_ASM_001096 /LENGTH=313 /DNA_ID=CAMNT_0043444789 /DNA_START=62 /DNA_END=1003 /DNA_ORIENTATION=-